MADKTRGLDAAENGAAPSAADIGPSALNPDVSGLLWDVSIGASAVAEDGDVLDGVRDDVTPEAWLHGRRLILERKVEEVVREASRLTTARVFGLIADDEVANLREVLRQPVEKDEFVDAICTCIRESVSSAARRYTSSEIRTCAEELFYLVDVNGNGSIDWGELTHYIVHSYEMRSEVTRSSSSWVEHRRLTQPAERCKGRKVLHFPEADKVVTLDYCHSGTAANAHFSLVSVYNSSQLGQTPHMAKPWGSLRSSYTIESAEWVTPLKQLVVSTSNSQLLWYSVKDEKDETRADRMQLVKHSHVDGIQQKLSYDPDADLLYCGNNRGALFGIRPEDTHYSMPDTVVNFKPHDGPITDILPLPTIGAKKVATCGLDAACCINDIDAGKVERQLVREHGERRLINNLSYSAAYSLLATSGPFDTDPTLWTPLAGQFISTLRDVENPHKGHLIYIHCVAETTPESPYLLPYHMLSADSFGMLKIWDIRKVTVLQTVSLSSAYDPKRFGADGGAQKHAAEDPSVAAVPTDHSVGRASASPGTTRLFDVAVDTSRGWVLSASRTDTERVVTVHAQLQTQTNGSLAHDGSVSFLLLNEAAGCFLTVSGRDVRLWDMATGTVRTTFVGVCEASITAVELDKHARRVIVGDHDGEIAMRTLATNGASGYFQKAPTEITSIFETTNETFVVLSGRHLLAYKYTENEETLTQPLFSMKVAETLTCSFYYPEVSVFGMGDRSENMTIVDTHSTAKVKVLAACRYGGDRGRLDGPDGGGAEGQEDTSVVEQTEARIRSYLHPKQGELCCMEPIPPYPLVAVGDINGYITVWSLRPHSQPYKVFARWKLVQTLRTLSPPVPASLLSRGDTLYATDDHGAVSVYSLKAMLSANRFVPARFPFGLGQEPESLTSPRPGHPAPGVMQAELLLSFPAHLPMTAARGLLTLAGERILVTYGADAHVHFWDAAGVQLGTLEQGKPYRDGDTTAPTNYETVALRLQDPGAPADADAAAEASAVLSGGDATQPRRTTEASVSPAAAATATAAAASDEDVSDDEAASTPQLVSRGAFAFATHAFWQTTLQAWGLRAAQPAAAAAALAGAEALLCEHLACGVSTKRRRKKLLDADDPAEMPGPPPPSPTSARAVRNKYTTPTPRATQVYHRETTVYNKTAVVRKGPNDDAFREKPDGDAGAVAAAAAAAADAVAAAAAAVTRQLNEALAMPPRVDSFDVVVFRRPRPAVFETASVVAALRSSPAAATDWRALVVNGPARSGWTAAAVVGFEPHEMLATLVPPPPPPPMEELAAATGGTSPALGNDWGERSFAGSEALFGTFSSVAALPEEPAGTPDGGGSPQSRPRRRSSVAARLGQLPDEECTMLARNLAKNDTRSRRRSLAEMISGADDDPLDQAARMLETYRGSCNSWRKLTRAAELLLDESKPATPPGPSSPRMRAAARRASTPGGGFGVGSSHGSGVRAAITPPPPRRRRSSAAPGGGGASGWVWSKSIVGAGRDEVGAGDDDTSASGDEAPPQPRFSATFTRGSLFGSVGVEGGSPATTADSASIVQQQQQQPARRRSIAFEDEGNGFVTSESFELAAGDALRDAEEAEAEEEEEEERGGSFHAAAAAAAVESSSNSPRLRDSGPAAGKKAAATAAPMSPLPAPSSSAQERRKAAQKASAVLKARLAFTFDDAAVQKAVEASKIVKLPSFEQPWSGNRKILVPPKLSRFNPCFDVLGGMPPAKTASVERAMRSAGVGVQDVAAAHRPLAPGATLSLCSSTPAAAAAAQPAHKPSPAQMSKLKSRIEALAQGRAGGVQPDTGDVLVYKRDPRAAPPRWVSGTDARSAQSTPQPVTSVTVLPSRGRVV